MLTHCRPAFGTTNGVASVGPSKRKGYCICFEHGSSPTWRLADSSGEVNASVRKLMKLILAWCAVRRQIPKAPRSCTEWHQMQYFAFLALRALQAPIPRLPRAKDSKASYVLSWTLRTLMLTLMDKEGVRRLTLDTGMSVWSFCNMWTDAQQYLRKL